VSTTPSDLDADRIARTFKRHGTRYDWPGASEIGAGGFGAVWKVHDTWLGHDVAIKISNQLLVDEIRMCREIDGQTVRIYDYLRGTGVWNAFSMELLGGHWMTLLKYIQDHRYKQNDLQHYLDCFEIARDVLRGLTGIHGPAYARTNRFVHADIKPHNLFVLVSPKKSKQTAFRMTRSGSVIKIIDLGVATDQGWRPGGFTPDYAYPNANAARCGHDLYSVSVMFLEMVTGQLPDHDVMRHKKRIGDAIGKLSSGSVFVDQIAKEFVRLCARAATQPAITAPSVAKYLEDALFALDVPYLLALRAINRGTKVGLKKPALADVLFSELAPHFGWQNKTKNRLAVLTDLIAAMYRREMLVRDGQKYHAR
jgi:eukaryotic-like serine/threonine-protein kinase